MLANADDDGLFMAVPETVASVDGAAALSNGSSMRPLHIMLHESGRCVLHRPSTADTSRQSCAFATDVYYYEQIYNFCFYIPHTRTVW